MEPGKIRLGSDAEVQIHPLHQRVQVLQCIPVDIRKDLTEEFLQELQVGGKASCRTAAALTGFIIVQCRDDVEGIQSSECGISYVDDLAVQIVCQLGIFILRIQDEDLGILGGQIQQKGLRGVGFTGTGLTYDNHVGVHPLAVPAEEIDKYGYAVGRTQLHAALIGNVGKDPGIHTGDGIRGNAPGFLDHGVIGRNLGTDKGLYLQEVHTGKLHAGFCPGMTNGFLHFRDQGTPGFEVLVQERILFGLQGIIGCNINIYGKQCLIL